jgi:uncharacterized glyoxalase superfamily protein PhnB
MKLRTGDPLIPARVYGPSLKGLTLNLLVREMEPALAFQRNVLGAEVLYSDPDMAILRAQGAEWMLHADHTYLDHPFGKHVTSQSTRGVGVEIRLHGRDPDLAQEFALKLGLTVISPPTDKGHGLREVYVVDPDGYTWVLDVPSDGRSGS